MRARAESSWIGRPAQPDVPEDHMSYVVLARKWRPGSFADVVGQKHVVTTLSAAVRSGRIAHAYLFAGPRGVGKTTIARILARALNCAKGPTEEPCGTCNSCLEIASGKSLDVIEIDGASNRRIEDARSIRETVQYAPLSGLRKVYIIDEAHMLTREAFNALLKTIEEPPEHVVFVLATTEPGKIPETITSRCQRFDFHRISEAEIEERLATIVRAEKIKVEDGALRLVAARADGGMRDAESLLDQLLSLGSDTVSIDDVERVLGIPDVDVYFAITDAAAESNPGAALGALAGALASGFDPRDLIDGIVEHVSNLLMMKAAPDPTKLVGRASEYAEREGASRDIGEADLVRMARIALDAQAAVRWSTQAALLVELAVVRMARLDRSVAIDDVLRTLSDGSPRRSPGGATGSAPGGSGRTGAPEGSTERGGGSLKKRSGRASATSTARERDAASGAVATAATTGAPATAVAAADEQSGGTAPPASAADYQGGVELWPDVLAGIRGAKPAIGAFLCDAVPQDFSGGTLLLTVPNGSRFHRDQLGDRGNMTVMEREATSVYGAPVRFRFEFVEAAAQVARAPVAGSATQVDAASPAPDDPGPGGAGSAPAGRSDGDVLDRVIEMFDGEVDESR